MNKLTIKKIEAAIARYDVAMKLAAKNMRLIKAELKRIKVEMAKKRT